MLSKKMWNFANPGKNEVENKMLDKESSIPFNRTREKRNKTEIRTFLTRASVDVLVTKYECITLYGWIPLAALKLFKCMQPWSLISG